MLNLYRVTYLSYLDAISHQHDIYPYIFIFFGLNWRNGKDNISKYQNFKYLCYSNIPRRKKNRTNWFFRLIRKKEKEYSCWFEKNFSFIFVTMIFFLLLKDYDKKIKWVIFSYLFLNSRFENNCVNEIWSK